MSFPNEAGRPILHAVPEADRDDHPLRPFAALATVRHCRRGQKIFSPGDPTEHWYRVASGMAGMAASLADGRRRVIDLLLPGSFFGFSQQNTHGFAAEAVVPDTVVERYPRHKIETRLAADPALAKRMLDIAVEAMARLQSRVLSVGGMTASQRVGSFLLDMAEHSADSPPDIAPLALSRYDIADYLCLSAETVSRTLSELRQRGAIALADPHRVVILDRAALAHPHAGSG